MIVMTSDGSISSCRYLMFLYYVNVIAFIVIVSSTISPSTVEWDRRHASPRQGENLSVTCTVPDLDLLTVVRVERRNDDKQTRMVLADNGDVKEPFAGNRRYRVSFNQRGSIGTTTINYIQIRGEDAGTLACYKLATSVDDNNIALLELKVLVPVQSVRLAKMSASGNVQSLEDDSEQDDPDSSNSRTPTITLTEVTFSSTSSARSDGVTCVAAVNGSLTPPDVRLMIDSRDVTGQFIVTEQSRIDAEPETESLIANGGGGRLGFYYGEKRMTYSTSLPDATWNGRTLTCVASQEGFPDTIAAAPVVVNYVPQIACHSHDVGIDLGKPLHLVCKIKSNPPPEVTWFFVDKNETVGNATNNNSRLTRTPKADGTNDEYEASLYLTDISASRLGVYRLTASNAVGVSEEMLEVRLRRDKANARDRENLHRLRGQPITAGGHAASSLSSAGEIASRLSLAMIVVGSTAVQLVTSTTYSTITSWRNAPTYHFNC